MVRKLVNAFFGCLGSSREDVLVWLLVLILFFSPYDSHATLGDFEGSSDDSGEEDEDPIEDTGAVNVFSISFSLLSD